MTPNLDTSIEEQRRVLLEKLQSQRRLIAERLGPPPEADTGYPRSKTMRFLTRRPGLSVTLIAELAALLVGARHARSVTAVMALARIVRSAAGNGAGRPPAA